MKKLMRTLLLVTLVMSSVSVLKAANNFFLDLTTYDITVPGNPPLAGVSVKGSVTANGVTKHASGVSNNAGYVQLGFDITLTTATATITWDAYGKLFVPGLKIRPGNPGTGSWGYTYNGSASGSGIAPGTIQAAINMR